MILLNT